jgi:hypothetical protein
MKRFALALVAMAGTAHADDCLDYGNATLFAQDGHLVACTGVDRCLRLDDAKAKPQKVAQPAEPPAAKSALETRDGKSSVCADGKCKPLPTKLAAAAAKAKQVHVTGDLSRVVLDTFELWSIDKDAPLAPTKPAKADTDSAWFTASGNAVIAHWVNCPDDYNCNGIATSVGADGKTIGAAFPDGRFIELDAHHAALLGAQNKMFTAIDTDSGNVLGSVKVIDAGQMSTYAVSRIDDTTVAIAWRTMTMKSWKIAWVKAAQTKAPTITGTRPIAVCPL